MKGGSAYGYTDEGAVKSRQKPQVGIAARSISLDCKSNHVRTMKLPAGPPSRRFCDGREEAGSNYIRQTVMVG